MSYEIINKCIHDIKIIKGIASENNYSVVIENICRNLVRDLKELYNDK